MKITVEFLDIDHANVASVSRQLRAKYRGFVEYEDVQQELYLWYIRQYHKVEEWRENYHEKTAQRMILKSLHNVGETYCRREKAEASGYSPADEFFYSIRMVEDMLVLYFDPDWSAPSVAPHDEPVSHTPPSEGGNLMAMVIDVGHAFEKAATRDKDLLARIYGGDFPVSDAIAYEAAMNSITPSAQRKRIDRVLGRLRKELGGPNPNTEVK